MYNASAMENIIKKDRPVLICKSDISRTSLLKRATDCKNWLQESDFRFSPTGRFARLFDAISSGTNDIILPDEKRFPLIRQSLKDLHELSFIIDAFGSDLYSNTLRNKFQDILTGDPLPNIPNKHTQGYDTQAELFVGAICKRSGMNPIPGDTGEPDWLISTPAFRLALEVKRCKTVKGLENHVRKAAGQISKSGRGGVIVLDVTHAFNPKHEQIKVPATEEMIANAHKKHIDHIMSSHLKNINNWIGQRSIGFVYVHQTIFRPGAKNKSWNMNWTAFNMWCRLDIHKKLNAPRGPYDEFANLFWAAQPRL